MAVALGRMVLSPTYFNRTDAFAKFYLADLVAYIAMTADAAKLLDEQVAAGMVREGLDPNDWENELDKAVCDLASCRNDMEQLHDMLCAIRDVALLEQAKLRDATVQ